jgi:AraC-like DNA-binding protein
MKDVLQKSASSLGPHGRLDPAGFDRHVVFRSYQPPEDLALFIEHFWALRWEEAEDKPYVSEQVMHRPYVDLYLSKGESGIQGTFRGKRAYVAAGTGRIVGARFRPGAFHAFYRGRIADLLDRNLTLREAFPQPLDVERLLTPDDPSTVDALVGFLRSQAPQPDSNIDLIGRIIAAVEADEGIPSVKAAADRFQRSERWLQQLFLSYVGVGLKWLLQRRRLLAAAEQIRAAHQPDWARIAYELGFSSQQHFITAFRQALGKTPVQYKNDLTRT